MKLRKLPVLGSDSLLAQILPEMIRQSSKLFHNSYTATPTYTNLDVYQKAASNGKVKDLSSYTHELRWVKSPAELSLMRESASIACQVLWHVNFTIIVKRLLCSTSFIRNVRERTDCLVGEVWTEPFIIPLVKESLMRLHLSNFTWCKFHKFSGIWHRLVHNGAI